MFAHLEIERNIQTSKSGGLASENDPRSLILKARHQIREAKYKDALQTLSAAGPSIPAEVRYLHSFLLGESYYWLAQPAPMTPGRIEEFYGAFRRNTHAKSALSALKRAVQLNPEFAPAFASLVEYRNRAGEWAGGRADADSLIKLVPHCAYAYYMRGCFLAQLERYASPIEDFEAALRLDPSDAKAHVEIAGARVGLSEYDSAVDSYKAAIALKYPYPSLCQYNIGNAYEKAGKYEQAIRAFEEARTLGWSAADCEMQIAFCRKLMR